MRLFVILSLFFAFISCDSNVEGKTVELNTESTKTLMRSPIIYGPDRFSCGRVNTYSHGSVLNLTSRAWMLKDPSGKIVGTSYSPTYSYYFGANIHGTYELKITTWCYHPKFGIIKDTYIKYITVKIDPSKHY